MYSQYNFAFLTSVIDENHPSTYFSHSFFKESENFGKFGLYLGRSFQITDDILDFIGEEETLGKPIGNDLGNARLTLPTILALETLDSDDVLRGIIKREKNSWKSVEKGLHIVKSSGGIEKAYLEAYKWQKKAMAMLSILPDNEFRADLKEIAVYSVERKK